VERFQSAPRVDLRGDARGRETESRKPGFNPRPALICGATRAKRAAMGIWQSFNPRPALICGATAAAPTAAAAMTYYTISANLPILSKTGFGKRAENIRNP
jgi:hypothetical protein